MNDLVAVARIVRPRGLRGEVIAEVLTDFPERVAQLESVIAIMPDADQRELRIDDVWFQNGRIVFRFDGIGSIESAEGLRNAEICIPESEVADLDTDEYFDWQLAGCVIETISGGTIGTVREVMRTGGTELLVVDGPEREHLIPFAETICVEVDIENKRIRVDPPDGLLEF